MRFRVSYGFFPLIYVSRIIVGRICIKIGWNMLIIDVIITGINRYDAINQSLESDSGFPGSSVEVAVLPSNFHLIFSFVKS